MTRWRRWRCRWLQWRDAHSGSGRRLQYSLRFDRMVLSTGQHYAYWIIADPESIGSIPFYACPIMVTRDYADALMPPIYATCLAAAAEAMSILGDRTTDSLGRPHAPDFG